MSKTIYTCPMHPEIQERAPGRCPTCGMKLEPAAARHSLRQASIGLTLAFVTLCIVAACGGGQPPAESPEMTPEPSEAPPSTPEPADTTDAGADSHTMPDGTTMPGAEHGETHQHEH